MREEKENSSTVTAFTSVQFIHILTMTDGIKYMWKTHLSKMNENGTWCSICLAPTNIFFHASLHFRVHPIFIKINVCITSITAWCYQCISESKMLFCCHKIFITTFNCLKIVQFNVSKWICYILRLVIAPQVERVEVKVKIRMDFLLTCHYMAESKTNIHNRMIITIDI